jgi:hypothetical protein
MIVNGILLTLLFVIFEFYGLLSANTIVWGPGLNPKIVLPARYFYIKYNQDE